MINAITNAIAPLYIIPILGLTASAIKPPIKFPAGDAAIQSVSLTAETFPRIFSGVFTMTVALSSILKTIWNINASIKQTTTAQNLFAAAPSVTKPINANTDSLYT